MPELGQDESLPNIPDEIVSWSEGRPAWQRDAMRRLFERHDLTEKDERDLLRMLKAEHGIADPEGPALDPRVLTLDDIPQSRARGDSVLLKKLNGLENVNQIDSTAAIEFIPQGLTIVYGGNATGKSGYVRVLKRACRARDDREPILPNVYREEIPEGPAKATFDLTVDGNDEQVEWTDGAASPDRLASIAVFDSRCARLYVDQEQVAYCPYGLEVLDKLAALCVTLRDALDYEARMLRDVRVTFDDLAGDTAVGQLISSLNRATSVEAVRTFSTLSESDLARLTELRKVVADAKGTDPELKAATLRTRKGRVEELASKIEALATGLSAGVVDVLRSAKAEAAGAAEAARLSSAEAFKEEALEGVGTEAWKTMFWAAREYSEKYAYPGQEFPVTEEDARCVLCQQPIQPQAAGRLAGFKAFLRKNVEKRAREKKAALGNARASLDGLGLQLDIDYSETIAELRERDSEMAEACKTFIASAKERQSAVRRALDTGEWETVPPLQPDPAGRLRPFAEGLEKEALQLDKAKQPAERARLEKELRELEARKKLAGRQADVLTHIARLKMIGCLADCSRATATHGITRKGSELTDRVVTKAFKELLSGELRNLGIESERLRLDSRGDSGSTYHRLRLASPTHGRTGVSSVFSEGEQRAIALASFFAELRHFRSTCSIVMDDPVSSLDHMFRSRVARRLVAEGATRQVIIFTHDLALQRHFVRPFTTLLPEPVGDGTRARRGCASGGILPSHSESRASASSPQVPVRRPSASAVS